MWLSRLRDFRSQRCWNRRRRGIGLIVLVGRWIGMRGNGRRSLMIRRMPNFCLEILDFMYRTWEVRGKFDGCALGIIFKFECDFSFRKFCVIWQDRSWGLATATTELNNSHNTFFTQSRLTRLFCPSVDGAANLKYDSAPFLDSGVSLHHRKTLPPNIPCIETRKGRQ